MYCPSALIDRAEMVAARPEIWETVGGLTTKGSGVAGTATVTR